MYNYKYMNGENNTDVQTPIISPKTLELVYIIKQKFNYKYTNTLR